MLNNKNLFYYTEWYGRGQDWTAQAREEFEGTIIRFNSFSRE